MSNPHSPGSIPAIPTLWNKIWYRSRLEARYAILFETLGIKASYEPDSYCLDGECYEPDFYLPQVNMFAEVKPKDPDEREIRVARKLSIATSRVTLLLIGLPDFRTYPAIHPILLDDGVETETYHYLLDVDLHQRRYLDSERRFYCCTEAYEVVFTKEAAFSKEYQQAVWWARTNRFEERAG